MYGKDRCIGVNNNNKLVIYKFILDSTNWFDLNLELPWTFNFCVGTFHIFSLWRSLKIVKWNTDLYQNKVKYRYTININVVTCISNQSIVIIYLFWRIHLVFVLLKLKEISKSSRTYTKNISLILLGNVGLKLLHGYYILFTVMILLMHKVKFFNCNIFKNNSILSSYKRIWRIKITLFKIHK